jgi:RimJ/RimL family protein N-acetyltransferase
VDVTIRPATENDIATLYAFQADAAFADMAATPSRDREAFEAHTRGVLADPTTRLYAIERDGIVVGSVGSWDAEGHREVGYAIGPDHWGHGVASAGLAAFLQVEPRRPLSAYVAAHNVASQRVLQKNGFVHVGTEQQDVELLVFRLDSPD